MLVLSRKNGETIEIGDRVTVTVLAIKGNRVQIGIEAPKEVAVLRGELPHRTEWSPVVEIPLAMQSISQFV